MNMKDFSDYCLFILGNKPADMPTKARNERVWHLVHFRNRGLGAIIQKIAHNGHNYAVVRSRAVWYSAFMPWMPWFRWDFKHFIKSFREWQRPKRIGFLFYREPENPDIGILTPIRPLHISETQEQLGHNTPLTLKAVVDDRSYLRSLRSLPFAKKVFGKIWPILLIGGVVGIVILLVVMGVIPTGGR